MRPYYADLAKSVANGFVTTLVTTEVSAPSANDSQVVEENGGGARTRTADLGIMRPLPPRREGVPRILNEFDFEEDTLP